MNSRRRILVTLAIGAACAPRASLAQPQSSRLLRIGYIDTSSASIASVRLDRLRAGLHGQELLLRADVLVE